MTRGSSRGPLRTCASTPPSTGRIRVTPSSSRSSRRAERLQIAVGLHGHDRVGADALLQRLRRVEGEDPAVVHDRDAVAELVGLLHVVRREQDRLPLVVELGRGCPTARAGSGGRVRRSARP